MSHIFIECGTTLASPFNTGIQRVVRNIVREAEAAGSAFGHTCQPVRFTGTQFVPIAKEALGTNASRPADPYRPSLKVRLHALLVRTDQLLRYILPEDIYRRVRKAVAPHVSNFYQRMLRSEGAGAQIAVYTPSGAGGLGPLIQHERAAHDSTILLLLDSSWDTRMWKAVDAFRSSGSKVCAVLYDLIPFSHPETVETHTRNAHTEWWKEAPLHIDAVMCISQTVRNQFLQWQTEMQLARKLPPESVGYFYLGSELLNGTDDHYLSTILLHRDPYFLMVGSVEPRKNHAEVLDAFELLWQQGRAVNLVMVGSNGWKSENFLARVRQHSMLGKRLFLMHCATDGELVLLYSRTTALIIASVAEGFGLPIVEAFQRGTNVICSDIPVFREVAGERASYFELGSTDTLVQAITDAMERVEVEPLPRTRNGIEWMSWQESAQQLITRAVICASGAQKQVRTHSPF